MAGKLSGLAIEANTITATQLSSNISNIRFGSTDAYANVARIFIGTSPDVTIANVTNYGGTAANGLIIQTGYVAPNPNDNEIGGLKITNEGVAIFGAGYDDIFRVVSKNGVYGEDVLFKVWGDGGTRGVSVGKSSFANGGPSYADGIILDGPLEMKSGYGLILYNSDPLVGSTASIRRGSANNLIIEAADSGNHVSISNTGNVGIGTTSASFPLDIRRDSGIWEIIRIKNSNAGAAAFITAVGSGGGSVDFGSDSGANTFVIRTATVERIRITETGNVGIGTTNPSTKLHVVGGTFTVENTNTFIVTPNYAGTTGIPAGILANSGNAANVTFIADAGSGTANRGVSISAFSGANWFRGLSYMNKSGTPDLVLQQDGGNVGIGTTSPSVKLHVEDGSMLLGDISGGSTSTPSGYKLQFDNSYAAGATDSSYAPKIVMHEATTWLGGFGISDSHVDYFSGGSHRWFTGTNPNTPTRGTLRLKIWDSGYITMPTQTMISARHNATEAPTGGNALLNWTVDVNQGGGSWNSGTGVYTVPVAGKYLVTCSLLRNTGGAAGGIQLYQNNAMVTRIFYVDSAGTTGYAMGSGQIIVNCGANDTLKFTNENTVSWYGDGAGLGSFTINLLG